MKYVCILQSVNDPERFYTGVTSNLKDRIKQHNAGENLHTRKYKPWQVKTYVGFSDCEKAIDFEKYLKTSSGRAFTKKRL